MAGYYGYSMSNNAIAAYNQGEKPWSKWTKADILSEIRRKGRDITMFQKLTVQELRKYCLARSSWHHTSSWYNSTDFYCVDDTCFLLDDDYIIDHIISKREPKPVPTERKATCEFLEWSGTRNHPKATEVVEEGIIKGNWFYRKDGTKKSINANGFVILN